MSRQTVQLDERQRIMVAKALADPRRVEILRQVGDAEKCCSCASILASQEIAPATLSHHMKELENAGLVDAARDGKSMRYTLRRDVLAAYAKDLAKI